MIQEAIISTLIGLATEGIFSKTKNQVVLLLKEKGFDVSPPNTFEGAYIHTLIEFGAEKPSVVVELFKHEFIQKAFFQAYEQNNTTSLFIEIENLIDWHEIGESFKELDVDPKTFVSEFAKVFHSVVDRTRTVYEIREEGKLDNILDNQMRLMEETINNSKFLEHFVTSVASNNEEAAFPEAIYKDRIEQARKLIKQGQSIIAKEILKSLESELEGKDISQKLQYEIYTNIASAHLHLEENEEACNYLEAAFVHNKKDSKANANAALSALIRGNNNRAIILAKESLTIDENQPHAISILLQASKKSNAKISDELKQKAKNHPESRRILGIFSFEQKDFETAEKYYRENLTLPSSEVQDTVLLAQAIIAAEEEKMSEGTHFLFLPLDMQKRLEEAEQLLLNTKSEWEKDNNRNRYANTLSLLIQAQSLQRKNDLVWANCQQILADFPDSYSALYHCGLIEFSKGNYRSSISYFEKALLVQDPLDIRDRRIPLATAYLLDKKFNKVITLLLDEIPSNSDRAKSERLVLLVKAYSALNDRDHANKIIELFDLMNKEDPYVLEGLAQAQVELGQHEQAFLNLELAYQQANEVEKTYFSVILAEFYYQKGKFEKAIPLYEISFTPNKDFPLLNHYLIALMNSGYCEKANTLAKMFRIDDPTNSLFLVIEARVSEYIGDLVYARDLYLQLIENEPENPEHLIRIALIDYRNGKNEDAFNLLSSNIDKFLNSPLDLMSIAQIGASAKKDPRDFLEYAYLARKLGVNNPNIHVAYVWLLVGGGEALDKFLEVTKVDINTSVCIQTSDGIKKWYTILNHGTAEKGKGELLSTDPLSQKLLGHQKNTVLTIRDDFYQKIEFTIIDIKSKYLAALHETLEEFELLFPENHSLRMMKVEDNNPTKAFAFAARQNQFFRQIAELYKKENLTIGQLSKLIGISQVECWISLGHNIGIVKVSLGTPYEQEKFIHRISIANDITLEITGLLTLANIRELNLLAQRFDNIYVAQTTLDTIIEEISSKQNFIKDSLTITADQSQIVVLEKRKEQTINYINFLEEIKVLIQDKCKIVPVKLALTMGNDNYKRLIDNFSASSVDSVLVAKETNTLLYSDDVFLRAIAETQFGVNGIWTQPILRNCFEKNHLSMEAYHNTIASLVFLNYNFVPVKVETLMFYLEKNHWNIASEVVRLFEVLGGPDTSIESAMQIALSCVKEVWSKKLMVHQKTAILTLILNSLVKNRLSVPVIQSFVNSIRKSYNTSFTPWYADEIIEHTNSWLQTYLSLNNKKLLH